jgi:hypothetical protein
MVKDSALRLLVEIVRGCTIDSDGDYLATVITTARRGRVVNKAVTACLPFHVATQSH